jgi:hypothetical protein
MTRTSPEPSLTQRGSVHGPRPTEGLDAPAAAVGRTRMPNRSIQQVSAPPRPRPCGSTPLRSSRNRFFVDEFNAAMTLNLSARGLIRPYCNGGYHPGGIDIDTNLHSIGTQGGAQGRIWAIGFLVEGQHFYTHALPRPMIASRQTRDAERCVLELFDAITSSAESCIPAAGQVI